MKPRRGKRALRAPDESEIHILDVMDAETVCAVCSAEFLDEEDLKLHIMQVHLHESNGKTICRFCYTILCGSDELATHIIYKHLGSLNFCVYCYRAFVSTKDVHEQKHRVVVVNRSVTCSQCTRIFTNRHVLQEHEYNEHRDNEGVMLNNIFALLSSALNIPMRKFFKLLSEHQLLTCTACNYSSLDLTEYIDHLKVLDCRSYSCNKCYKVFKTKRGMHRHLVMSQFCQNYFREQEQCLKCDERFDVALITEHVASCSAVKCPSCSIVFNSMSDLTQHRLEEHNVSVTLQTCKFCKREFVGTFNLKKHIRRSHKDYKLYKYRCTHCDDIFMHPSKLFAHYFTQHKELQPYTCKICDKKFKLRKQFTIHIKIVHKSIGFVEFDENLHVFFTDIKSEKPFNPTSENVGSEDDSDDDNIESCQKSEVKVKKSKANLGNTESIQETDEQSTKITDEQSTGITDEQYTEITDGQSTEITDEKSIEITDKQSVDKTDERSTEKTDEQSTKKIEGSIEKSNAEISIDITETSQDTTDKSQNSEDMNLLILKTDLVKTKQMRGNKKVQSGMKRKRKPRAINRSPAKRRKAVKKTTKLIDLSDDEPLSNVRESLLKQNNQNTMSLKMKLRLRNKRTKLTCKICNKYCYTVQNYHHHMSLHENSKLKRCIKCHEKFKSEEELKNHIDSAHSSSKLTETLKSLLEKRKKSQPGDKDKSSIRPAESIKSLVEKRKRSLLMSGQGPTPSKFRKTIKKVEVVDDCSATITPMSDHGLSVKNFIENFRPDTADGISISNSVTIKTLEAPVDKQPLIKMQKFNAEDSISPGKLRFPVKFKDNVVDTKNQVKVTLVQQLITKPKLLNLNMDERIPVMSPPPKPEYNEYCNTFADETDYTQYKSEAPIPDVAHEVMLGEADDVPRTRQLAQEIIIPNIPDKYGGVRIGHLLPDAPFYKIVKVKKLLKGASDSESDEGPPDKNIQLPDGTQLVTVKNPFSHLIPNEHLEELLKANRNRYYTPKTKNIEKALAKALKAKPVVTTKVKSGGKRGRKKKEIVDVEKDK